MFIDHLTLPQGPPLDELDPSLSQDCRDLKVLLLSSKDPLEEFKTSVSLQLTSMGQGSIMDKTGLNGFKSILRNALMLGMSTGHSKEFKDIFINVQEKMVEPAIGLGWSGQDLEDFFKACVDQFRNLNFPGNVSVNQSKRWVSSFDRWFTALQLVSVRMLSTLSSLSSR